MALWYWLKNPDIVAQLAGCQLRLPRHFGDALQDRGECGLAAGNGADHLQLDGVFGETARRSFAVVPEIKAFTGHAAKTFAAAVFLTAAQHCL